MSTIKNVHGLSRNIPADIKRKIRQVCGYGCVVCGSAIYQYEHIDPEFHEAKEHDSENMALLCGACHTKVTQKYWSKAKIKEARRNPFCIINKKSHFEFDVSADLIIKIGNNEFINLEKIIEIDGISILSIFPPEEEGSPPRISAQFFDRNNRNIAYIEENEWYGLIEAFDIETIGGRFSIHSEPRKIDLVINLTPPNLLEIEQLSLLYRGVTISGNKTQGFEVTINQTKLKIPPTPNRIDKAPFWIKIKDDKIYYGVNAVGHFNDKPSPGAYVLRDVEFEEVNPIEENIPLPPGIPQGTKLAKVTGKGSNNFIGWQFSNLLQSKPSLPKPHPKIGRNEPCYCGSGKKYKKCHGKHE